VGYLIDEKRFINDNIVKFQERTESIYTRFLDKQPSFVTYYNINNIESTTDTGLCNVEQILGSNSPLRFNKITDFPIYGIDAILLDLTDEDEGLTSSVEQEGIILPNTIKPYPNDFFTISYLNKDYMFMITTIAYDFIKSNNFYKVNFIVRSLTPDQPPLIERQTNGNFHCVFRNIGTEDKCIIQTDDFNSVISLNSVYKKLVDKYRVIFYNKKYNSVIMIRDMVPIDILYDPFLTNFITKNGLFVEQFNYDTIRLENEDDYCMFEIDYENSVYRSIENRDKTLLPDQLLYTPKANTLSTSIFNYYMDSAYSVSFKLMVNNYDYIPSNFLQQIKDNQKPSGNSPLRNIIVDYFNNSVTKLSDLDISAILNFSTYFHYDFETYVFIPVVLYILRQYYFAFIKTNN
jgi:hypothetical protein